MTGEGEPASHLGGFTGRAFDGSPVAMAIVGSRDGRYLRVNAAACRLLGRSREELLRLSASEISHPEDLAARSVAGTARLLATLGELTFEKRYFRGDGSVVWAKVFLTPVRSAAGELSAFFVQIIDVGAVRELEGRLVRERTDTARLAELRAALREGRLVLDAQPIVDLVSGEVVQQELLVRLRLESGEVMPPDWFLPTAERFGCVGEIDRWVCRQALRVAAAGSPVEVNLSAESIGDEELLAMLRCELSRRAIDPANLVFEITETAMIADLDRGRAFAEALRELGCSFALDDFGTGWGTLMSVKHIPIDYIKIDREFVRDLARNDTDARLVKTIVRIAREFGKRTIAEGVEDEVTLQRLRDLGVDLAQGFHLGRPRRLEASDYGPPAAALLAD